MGIVIVFLLAVLFVAAVWGRDAAQKLFKKGMIVGTIFVGFIAVIVIALAINLKAPDQADIDRSLATSKNSAYRVPLEAPSERPGDFLLRTATPAPMYAGYSGDLGNPKIGVGVEPMNVQNAALYGLPAGYGIFVSGVNRGSTAEAIGIHRGDFITAVDGKWITDLDAINRNNVGKRPGDIITLHVIRDGKQYDVRLPLGQP